MKRSENQSSFSLSPVPFPNLNPLPRMRFLLNNVSYASLHPRLKEAGKKSGEIILGGHFSSNTHYIYHNIHLVRDIYFNRN